MYIILQLLRLLNPPKWTEIHRFTFQSGLTVVFLCSEIACLWFSLPLAVVTGGFGFLFTASCTGMQNSDQGRSCGNPKNHATVPSRSLFHHTCLITRNKSNSAKQLKNNTKHTARQSQKAATASAQQRRKQRQRHQRRQLQNEQQHMQRWQWQQRPQQQ